VGVYCSSSIRKREVCFFICRGGPGRVEMVTRAHESGLKTLTGMVAGSISDIESQFEPTVSKCKDKYMDICILKIMDRTS